MVGAHRIAWQQAFGPIPEGLQVCHRCDTPACCNPAHLFLGTAMANMRDKYSKGREAHTRGHGHGPTKLTEDQVRTIRADARGPYAVARAYGVSPRCIYDIRSGKNWGWLQ
ncbi:HNH endonuclease [Xanthomonas citri pv. citri]